MNKNNYIYVCILFLWVFTVQAQNDVDGSIELVQKYSDTVSKVHKKNKILPIVIPITEPAIGYGLTAGLLYFFQKKDSTESADMAAGTGGYTSNGTWFVGGGYLGYWKNDRLRYTGVVGYGHINLDYYGFGKPIAFSQDVSFLMQQFKFRIGDSEIFAGGKIQFSKITIPIGNENFDLEDIDVWNNSLGALVEYDNLNNNFSPTKGLKLHLGYDQVLQFMGSQRDWGRLDFYTHWYIPVNEFWIPAFRFEFNTATGRPPFYGYPYVNLRGIPAMRYQAKSTVVIETEHLFNVSKRWGVVGFTGIGSTLSSVDINENNELVWNAGAGVRFLAIKTMGIKLGADMARGPEEWAFYLSVGSAW